MLAFTKRNFVWRIPRMMLAFPLNKNSVDLFFTCLR